MKSQIPMFKSQINIKKQILIVFFSLLITHCSLLAQDYTIKFATLATEGSTWMNVMKEFDQAIRKESGGKLGFKLYGGGVQGDEKDVIRKIKLGQLHCAGVTGNGLTNIAPKVRIMDSPFLFKSYEEADYIYQKFDKEFNQAFQDGGYVLLGWAEVGFVYIYTNEPVKTPEDMKGVKMWMWEGDPIAEASFKALGVNPIPLSITDVLTSLQTRLIDGVYTSPLAVIALQWFTRVKYVLNAPLADACGAVILSKKKFDEIPPNLQEILLRNGKIYMQKLTKLSREDNAKSIETLKKNGLQFVDSPKNSSDKYDELGKQARRMLVGKLFSEELMNNVEGAVQEFRSKRTK